MPINFLDNWLGSSFVYFINIERQGVVTFKNPVFFVQAVIVCTGNLKDLLHRLVKNGGQEDHPSQQPPLPCNAGASDAGNPLGTSLLLTHC